MRSLICSALLVAVLAASATPAGATVPQRSRSWRDQMLNLVNGSRRHHGVRPLDPNWRLCEDAWRHSVRMADRHRLFHTRDLGSVVRRYRPSAWGENVGMGGTLKRIERMFMRSAPHRANILNRRYHRIGVGVASGGRYLWVTLDFYG
jgi:uncharacterized protein YkwD